jgi:hypothetical protein
MMVNGYNVRNLGEEQIFSRMVINTWVNIKTVSQMDKVHILGILEANMKETFLMD